jgi:hypothetical protein
MEVQFCINNIFENVVNHEVTYESLCEYFKNNYYGKIFVKKMNSNLVLICNSFDTKAKITASTDLYNECRSLIVSTGSEPRVISYTHDNIEYLKITQHNSEPGDIYEESFEGTMISTFCYEGTWHFTTSRCGSIDSSYFYDKSKSFGMLFDDCILALGYESRDQFVLNLDPNLCYYWVIVHHENKYVIDYTERFGPCYSKLIHVITRSQASQSIVPNPEINEQIIQPQQFENYQTGLDWIIRETQTEGLIVKRFNQTNGKIQVFKIHSDKYWLSKSHNPNYSNRWFGYLDIFKKDDPTFGIKDYQSEKGITENITIGSKEVDITGMIYLMYKGTSEVLFDFVIHFTKFDSGRFEKINSLDYLILQDSKFGVLRKQLSTLQGLISKKIIRSSADVATHLRKFVSIEDFVGLLKCVQQVITNPTVNYVRKNNKNYNEFITKYLELITN